VVAVTAPRPNLYIRKEPTMRRLFVTLVSSIIATASLAGAAQAHPGGGYGYDTYTLRGARVSGPIEVQWGVSWYSASLLAQSGDQYLIHYEGWSSSFDEWVGADRIRAAGGAVDRFGDPIQVSIQWGGSWYPGRVMKRDGGRMLVSYDGWSPSFDEWVGPERVRFVEPAPIPVAPRYDGPRYDGPRYDGPRYDGPRYDAPRYQAPRKERPRHVRPARDGWGRDGR